MSNYKYILYMAALLSLILTHPQESIAQTQLGANEDSDLFTHAMATGDFDGDGLMDLAVGAQGESPGGDPKPGIIFVYQGTDVIGLQPWKAHTQSSRQPNDYSLGINEKGENLAIHLLLEILVVNQASN
ncbi:MAG: FG-GAP repeat protein [Methylococcaceae bacterium]